MEVGGGGVVAARFESRLVQRISCLVLWFTSVLSGSCFYSILNYRMTFTFHAISKLPVIHYSTIKYCTLYNAIFRRLSLNSQPYQVWLRISLCVLASLESCLLVLQLISTTATVIVLVRPNECGHFMKWRNHCEHTLILFNYTWYLGVWLPPA